MHSICTYWDLNFLVSEPEQYNYNRTFRKKKHTSDSYPEFI